jgi:hypothetical protein
MDIKKELNTAVVNEAIAENKVHILEKELKQAQERIMRLEEALNGTVKWIVDLAESGDAGFWDADTFPEVIAARAALNTKEVKP